MANIKKWEEGEKWVEIDLDLCKGAAECENWCPVGVYVIEDGKVNAANIEDCIGCQACQTACPTQAILRHWAWT
jgi:NAD-dependent dihydropyrimidine dehydrogenase PreA subunit